MTHMDRAGRLRDKVAVITGGAGTVGQAAGRLFAREGAKVLLVDMDRPAVERAARSMDSESVGWFEADVTDPDRTRGFIEAAVERYGGLDVLLLNAGYEGLVTPITEYPLDVFDRVMALNVRAVWLGLKYAIPFMRDQGGGSIVITSSLAGIKGSANVSAYCASKHAVVGLMRTASLECAPWGIRVNTVNPSPVEGRMMESLEAGQCPENREKARRRLLRAVPLGRYADPEEVAALMLFLASDESRFCTGGVYAVDGGSSAF